MDAALFAKMLSDPMLVHLKKLKYKYPQADLSEFIALLQDGFYRSLAALRFPRQSGRLSGKCCHSCGYPPQKSYSHRPKQCTAVRHTGDGT